MLECMYAANTRLPSSKSFEARSEEAGEMQLIMGPIFTKSGAVVEYVASVHDPLPCMRLNICAGVDRRSAIDITFEISLAKMIKVVTHDVSSNSEFIVTHSLPDTPAPGHTQPARYPRHQAESSGTRTQPAFHDQWAASIDFNEGVSYDDWKLINRAHQSPVGVATPVLEADAEPELEADAPSPAPAVAGVAAPEPEPEPEAELEAELEADAPSPAPAVAGVAAPEADAPSPGPADVGVAVPVPEAMSDHPPIPLLIRVSINVIDDSQLAVLTLNCVDVPPTPMAIEMPMPVADDGDAGASTSEQPDHLKRKLKLKSRKRPAPEDTTPRVLPARNKKR
jgi:hypothetical protein